MTTAAEAKAANNPGDSDAYYLQGDSRDGTHVGASETYAEGFARYIARDKDLQHDWPNVYRYFDNQDKLFELRAKVAQK